jgi:vacuolar protein sorting-associated protein 13A/C
MFEGLLESVLNRVLGQYIQGLNRNDLSVSVWSGDVHLTNVKLKPDIFQQFKLPLKLIYGRIGNLKISLPWKYIGTQPVDAVVENVVIVFRKSLNFFILQDLSLTPAPGKYQMKAPMPLT